MIQRKNVWKCQFNIPVQSERGEEEDGGDQERHIRVGHCVLQKAILEKSIKKKEIDKIGIPIEKFPSFALLPIRPGSILRSSSVRDSDTPCNPVYSKLLPSNSPCSSSQHSSRKVPIDRCSVETRADCQPQSVSMRRKRSREGIHPTFCMEDNTSDLIPINRGLTKGHKDPIMECNQPLCRTQIYPKFICSDGTSQTCIAQHPTDPSDTFICSQACSPLITAISTNDDSFKKVSYSGEDSSAKKSEQSKKSVETQFNMTKSLNTQTSDHGSCPCKMIEIGVQKTSQPSFDNCKSKIHAETEVEEKISSNSSSPVRTIFCHKSVVDKHSEDKNISSERETEITVLQTGNSAQKRRKALASPSDFETDRRDSSLSKTTYSGSNLDTRSGGGRQSLGSNATNNALNETIQDLLKPIVKQSRAKSKESLSEQLEKDSKAALVLKEPRTKKRNTVHFKNSSSTDTKSGFQFDFLDNHGKGTKRSHTYECSSSESLSSIADVEKTTSLDTKKSDKKSEDNEEETAVSSSSSEKSVRSSESRESTTSRNTSNISATSKTSSKYEDSAVSKGSLAKTSSVQSVDSKTSNASRDSGGSCQSKKSRINNKTIPSGTSSSDNYHESSDAPSSKSSECKSKHESIIHKTFFSNNNKGTQVSELETEKSTDWRQVQVSFPATVDVGVQNSVIAPGKESKSGMSTSRKSQSENQTQKSGMSSATDSKSISKVSNCCQCSLIGSRSGNSASTRLSSNKSSRKLDRIESQLQACGMLQGSRIVPSSCSSEMQETVQPFNTAFIIAKNVKACNPLQAGVRPSFCRTRPNPTLISSEDSLVASSSQKEASSVEIPVSKAESKQDEDLNLPPCACSLSSFDSHYKNSRPSFVTAESSFSQKSIGLSRANSLGGGSSNILMVKSSPIDISPTTKKSILILHPDCKHDNSKSIFIPITQEKKVCSCCSAQKCKSCGVCQPIKQFLCGSCGGRTSESGSVYKCPLNSGIATKLGEYIKSKCLGLNLCCPGKIQGCSNAEANEKPCTDVK